MTYRVCVSLLEKLFIHFITRLNIRYNTMIGSEFGNLDIEYECDNHHVNIAIIELIKLLIM